MGNSQITNKGKNLDMSTFYAFLILEDKDLKFVSRSLQAGVGAGAGLGTVGGGASAAVSNRKRDITDAAFLQLETATNRLSDLSAHSARLFSPSPTFAGEALTALGVLVLNPCHMFLRRRVKLLLKESSFVSRSRRNIISMCWHLMFTMMKKKRKRRRV